MADGKKKNKTKKAAKIVFGNMEFMVWFSFAKRD
jgi:hypothetical protein